MAPSKHQLPFDLADSHFSAEEDFLPKLSEAGGAEGVLLYAHERSSILLGFG